jgi:hypothetical protein
MQHPIGGILWSNYYSSLVRYRVILWMSLRINVLLACRRWPGPWRDPKGPKGQGAKSLSVMPSTPSGPEPELIPGKPVCWLACRGFRQLVPAFLQSPRMRAKPTSKPGKRYKTSTCFNLDYVYSQTTKCVWGDTWEYYLCFFLAVIR